MLSIRQKGRSRSGAVNIHMVPPTLQPEARYFLLMRGVRVFFVCREPKIVRKINVSRFSRSNERLPQRRCCAGGGGGEIFWCGFILISGDVSAHERWTRGISRAFLFFKRNRLFFFSVITVYLTQRGFFKHRNYTSTVDSFLKLSLHRL